MRKLTQQVWEELTQKPVKLLKDVELAQLRRSNRGGSRLRSAIIAEQLRRELIDPSTHKEHIKNLRDYPDPDTPIKYSIDELSDFHLPLEVLRDKIEELIAAHGPRAQIFVDAGYNNVSVYIETATARNGVA